MVLTLASFAVTVNATAQNVGPGENSGAEPLLAEIDCPATRDFNPGNLVDGEVFSFAVLTVPRDHERPNGPLLQLFVIELFSKSDNPAAEPVIFLAGSGRIAYTLTRSSIQMAL